MSSPRFPTSREEIEQADFFTEHWYYSMELVPGVYTPGANHRNIGLTRQLLARTEVEGRSCLDIGTMEAAVPFCSVAGRPHRWSRSTCSTATTGSKRSSTTQARVSSTFPD